MEPELSHHPEKTCFVISPIGEENSEIREKADTVYYNVVEPAAVVCGLECVRSDRLSGSGLITTEIISHMFSDKMVVADLSDHNPNVFYELAVRHAFRKPVVQLLLHDQKLPFDVQGVRTVRYDLKNAESTHKARETVQHQIATALSPNFEVESPLTIAARVEDLSRSSSPQVHTMFRTILEEIAELNKGIADMTSSGLLCRPEDLREIIPGAVKDQTTDLLGRFSAEIDLLGTVKEAGVIGIDNRREMALKRFGRELDEELRDIMVVGSSLKGLLQKSEFVEVADKLKFKIAHGVQVKFLLTHPIVADFRASQENRKPTEIGREIINTLQTLSEWHVSPSNVRLYLGTPTCFAIRTSRRMIINPYPYMSVSYESPCLLLDRSGYLFDQFKARHFGAWDTGLAVHIRDFEETIRHCESMLTEYAADVDSFLSKGRVLNQSNQQSAA